MLLSWQTRQGHLWSASRLAGEEGNVNELFNLLPDSMSREEKVKEMHREANRRWCAKNRPKLKAKRKAREQKHLNEYRAQRELRKHVFRGTLVKPDKCSACGTVTERRALFGHHEDYDKRFDVMWLCRTCHRDQELARGRRVEFMLGEDPRRCKLPWSKRLSATQPSVQPLGVGR